jgi:hypothetical protein
MRGCPFFHFFLQKAHEPCIKHGFDIRFGGLILAGVIICLSYCMTLPRLVVQTRALP